MMKQKAIATEEAKKIMFDIMSDFDAFCRKHGLRMWLYAGTLLGAVRHKGYIPWDDDIDVCMPREDYEKLIKIADEIDPKYTILEHRLNKKYAYPFMKVSLTDSSCVEFHDPKFCGVKLGIYIDVFPIDYVGDTLEEAKEHCKKTEEMRLSNLKLLQYDIVASNAFVRGLKKIKRYFVHKFETTKLLNKFNALITKYDHPTKYSAVPVWMNAAKTILETKDYQGNKTLTFEGKVFSTFDGYIHFLETLFGDYMKLPPLEQRETHGFEAYIIEK